MAGKVNGDTWAAAFDLLDDDDRSCISEANSTNQSQRDLLDDVLLAVDIKKEECVQKQWRIKRGDRMIVLRDIFSKVAVWVQRFIAVGDTIVQYDPGHAALPWAAIRFVLKVAVHDMKIYAAVIDLTELITKLTPRCAIMEHLYLQDTKTFKICDRLQDGVVQFYAHTLRSLAHTTRHYKRNTVSRIAKSVITCPGDIEKWSIELQSHYAEVERLAVLADAEKLEQMGDSIKDLGENIRNATDDTASRYYEMKECLKELEKPIERIDKRLQAIEDELEKQQRISIFKAISTIPYPTHHKAVAQDRLGGSGRWLIEHESFREWCEDSTSSVLWLHGIPGSGKTKLTSLVVDTLRSTSHLAYFYCVRNPAEPERAECDKILNCLLRQLASVTPGGPILPPVRNRYEDAISGFYGFEDQAWTTAESIEVLTQVIDLYPAVTLVIDALDEVNEEDRMELLDSLTRIISASQSLVKVFISSRDIMGIVLRLEDSPNLRIGAKENAGDIIAFVQQRLQSARLLHGKLPQSLHDKIAQTLMDGAHGMFRWVDLQIQALRPLKVSADIEAMLGHLPRSLEESYWNIYTQILESGENAASLAQKTFQWLLCAQSSLTIDQFAILVSAGSDAEFSSTEVQDVCLNLITDKGDGHGQDHYDNRFNNDASNSFTFAHLSVREFLESLPKRGITDYQPAKANSAIATICLRYLSARFQRPAETNEDMLKGGHADHEQLIERYAVKYWVHHVCESAESQGTEPLHSLITSFLIDNGEIAQTYKLWCKRQEDWEDKPPHNLIAFVHDFDFVNVQSLEISDDTLRREQRIAFIHAANTGQVELMKSILEQGLDLSVVALDASRSAHPDAICFLLDKRATIDPAVLYHIINHQYWDVLPELFEKTTVPFTPQQLSKALTLVVSNSEIGTLPEQWDLNRVIKEPVAIVRALRTGSKRSANRLIDFGFNVHGHYLQEWRTALHWAAEKGYLDTVSKLLERKVAVNAHDYHGDTPLHLASMYGHADIVIMLLEQGASTREQNIMGRNALHYAAMIGRTDIVTALCEYGAIVDERDREGWTTIQLAQMYQHSSLLEVLDPTSRSVENQPTKTEPSVDFQPPREKPSGTPVSGKQLTETEIEKTRSEELPSINLLDPDSSMSVGSVPLLCVVEPTPPESPALSAEDDEMYPNRLKEVRRMFEHI